MSYLFIHLLSDLVVKLFFFFVVFFCRLVRRRARSSATQVQETAFGFIASFFFSFFFLNICIRDASTQVWKKKRRNFLEKGIFFSAFVEDYQNSATGVGSDSTPSFKKKSRYTYIHIYIYNNSVSDSVVDAKVRRRSREQHVLYERCLDTRVCACVCRSVPSKKKKTSKLLSLLCNLLTMKRSAIYC